MYKLLIILMKLKKQKKKKQQKNKKSNLNMLIRTYSLITNKITRSFKMVLLGEINNSNRYIIKIY